MSRILVASVSVLSIAFFLACGSGEEAGPAEPAELAPVSSAADSFLEARSRVDALTAELAERRAQHEVAVTGADEARGALTTAEDSLAESQAAVDETVAALASAEQELADLQPDVSDDELFRNVQQALLESEALSQVAIRAEVQDGRIVLHGTVPDERLRTGAEQIAKSVPGVRALDNQIEVAL